MPLSLGLFSVANTLGLFALLSVVPLIILYLIRPKPKQMNIPSLMFFVQYMGANQITSFLKQITQDLLFYIQLLALILLSLTIANPFTMYTHDITAENTVIVIDASASSQVHENGKTRLQLEIEKARTLLGRKNTLIVAKSVPLIGVKDASIAEAMEYLSTIKPRDTTTKLGDAIMLAGEALSGREGRVIVLSDFINTEGQDPQTAKVVLQSKGIIVDFVDITTGQARSNVGFVDIKVEAETTTAYIRNFDAEQRTATLLAGTEEKTLTIPAGGTEVYHMKTPGGVTKLRLDVKDDFPVDNIAFVSAPELTKVKVLLISNNASVFLKNALIASDEVELRVTEPPIVPKEDFDVYVIHDVNVEDVLPGTFEDIAERVEKNGASVIIHAQENSDKIDYKGLLHVKLGEKGKDAPIATDQLNRFTKDAEFGNVLYYFKTTKDDGIKFASALNSSMISYAKKGAGKRLYFGILEKASDFKFSTGYPIFWTELMRFLTEQQNVANLNYKTGQTIILDTVDTIETPTKKLKQSALMLEEQGIYKMSDRTIAANLINEFESSINFNATYGQKGTEFKLRPVKEKRKLDLEVPFIIIAALLLLIELFYVKMRGDL